MNGAQASSTGFRWRRGKRCPSACRAQPGSAIRSIAPSRICVATSRLDFVSVSAAEDHYGLVFDAAGDIDETATGRHRLAERRDRPPFDFGPHRTAWEAVFDDATMNALASALLALPKSVRHGLKQEFFRRGAAACASGRSRNPHAALRDRNARAGDDRTRSPCAADGALTGACG